MLQYKSVHHCHLDPHHGKPVHDYKNGTAKCKWCGWEAALRQASDRFPTPLPDSVFDFSEAAKCSPWYECDDHDHDRHEEY